MSMHIVFTPEFRKAYKQLPHHLQKIVDEKIHQLRSNPAHPSLKVHRHLKGKADHLWICRISTTKRLLYTLEKGTIYLQNVGNHSIIERV